jgi:two-component system, cell cycle response regulator
MSACLVVDDSAVARTAVRRVLMRSGLFEEVLLAADGAEALAVLGGEEAGRLDLVLCDLMMPGIDGFGILERMVGDAELGTVPVIVLTGEDTVDLKVRALEAGAADYLVKPFHDAELLARVRVHRNLKKLRDELEAANARLRELVVRDPLTGVFNRRHWSSRLHLELERCLRHERPLAVMMLDVDHFKTINDRHGHAVGDQVLVAVAECLRANLRGPDTVARYGGEEFTVLLPETGADTACCVAERLLDAVRAIEVPRAPGLQVRASAGVAAPEAGGVPPAEPHELMAAADRALYEAKRGGRDRVCLELLAGVAATPATR